MLLLKQGPAEVLLTSCCCMHTLVLSMLAVQVAASLEKAVEAALDRGFRTGDLMSSGMKQVGCSQMGDILEEAVAARQPAAV